MTVCGAAPVLRSLFLRESQVSELKKQLEFYMKENHGAGTDESCEYPYPYFNLYLKKRKLDYLVDLVTWASPDQVQPQPQSNSKIVIEPRSKLYINILKARLAHLHPDRNKTLVRNEAHIRLASGLWHACGTLRPLAVVGLALTVLSRLPTDGPWVVLVATLLGVLAWAMRKRLLLALALLVATFLVLLFGGAGEPLVSSFASPAGPYVGVKTFFATEFWTLVFPVMALSLSIYFRAKIETFIHYQRMREVQQVLEAAYFSYRHERWLLSPPFDDFANKGRRSSPRGPMRRPAIVRKIEGKTTRTAEFKGLFLDVSKNGEGASVVLWQGPLTVLKIADTLEVELQGAQPAAFRATAKHVELEDSLAHVGLQLEPDGVYDLLQLVEDDGNRQTSRGFRA